MRDRSNTEPIYIFITPDRIQHLSVYPGEKGIFYKSTRTLAFQLRAPLDVVLPLEPKEMTAVTTYSPASSALTEFYNIASQRYFACHYQHPGEAVPTCPLAIYGRCYLLRESPGTQYRVGYTEPLWWHRWPCCQGW